MGKCFKVWDSKEMLKGIPCMSYKHGAISVLSVLQNEYETLQIRYNASYLPRSGAGRRPGQAPGAAGARCPFSGICCAPRAAGHLAAWLGVCSCRSLDGPSPSPGGG